MLFTPLRARRCTERHNSCASLQFSVDCLISRAALLLRHPPALTTAESPFAASPLAGAHLAQGYGGMAGFLAGEDALWAAAARSVPVLAQGPPIAALEVEHARLDLQVKPEAMTAVVLVMNVAARDLLTHGPGMAEELLGAARNQLAFMLACFPCFPLSVPLRVIGERVEGMHAGNLVWRLERQKLGCAPSLPFPCC